MRVNITRHGNPNEWVTVSAGQKVSDVVSGEGNTVFLVRNGASVDGNVSGITLCDGDQIIVTGNKRVGTRVFAGPFAILLS